LYASLRAIDAFLESALAFELFQWLCAFGLTQAVEIPIYWRAHSRQKLVRAFLASALTHPIVWWVIPKVWVGGYWHMVLFSEAFAVIGEAIYLSLLDVKDAWLWSLCANGASCGIGFLIYAAFGWV
jgi:hypothetical protein